MPNLQLSEKESNKSYLVINQVMGNVPSWIVYWGITAIAIFFIVMLGLATFIRYPDTLKTEAIAYTNELPIEVFTKQTGVIAEVLVSNNDTIQYGYPLAILESTANWKNILQLDTLLQKTSKVFLQDFHISTTNLGIVSNAYQDFLLLNKKMLHTYQNDITSEKTASINEEIIDNTTLYQSLLEQKAVYEKELINISKELERSRSLFKDGVMSLKEFEEKENFYLQNKRGLQNMQSALINNEMNRKKMQLSKIELDKQQKDLFVSIEHDFLQKRTALQNLIEDWKNNYIISSPCSGTVAMAQQLQKGSLVNSSQSLMTIIPKYQHQQSLLQAFLDANGIGKLAIGQTAIVYFDNYPAIEYGTLTAIVKKIAPIPKNKKYQIILELPNHWNTNYGFTIPQQQNMSSTIVIQTKNYTLLERIFSGLLDALKN